MYQKVFFSLHLVLQLLLFVSRDSNMVSAQLLRSMRIPFLLPVKNVCPPYSITSFRFSLPFENCDKAVNSSLIKRHPDQDKNTAQYLHTYGYDFKSYNVTTADNYILRVYRIFPKITKNNQTRKKFPVLLQHGIFAASDTWNFQPGSRNLPFKLVDAGYEVWLANSRGTSYSLGHTVYNANKDLAYWDFSFHEMGIYDVPAVTEKILKESGADKIIYIGNSMGATQYFVSLSEVKEMNNKIQAAFLLSPVAYIGHTYYFLRWLNRFATKDAVHVLNVALKGRFTLQNAQLEQFGISFGNLCTPTLAQCGLCDNVLFLSSGYNAAQLNATELPNIVSKFVHSVSVKTIAHYAQLIHSCEFRQYDYGLAQNGARYGSSEPPEYKLGNIRVPTHIYFAERDNLATPPDVNMTASQLLPGVLKTFHKVEDKLFTHSDFLIAKDADLLVYNHILKSMNQLE